MWQRLTWHDARVIGHYLGVLVLFSIVIYAVPLITAVLLREWEPASRYLFAIGICLLVGSGLRFLKISPSRLSRQQAMVVTGLAWIVLALIASIPLYQSGHYVSYLDALFDGVSGLTTTGATTITDLEHLAYSDNMFRFMMHLLGGLGLVVVALSLGILGRGGGNSLYASEGRSEHVVPNIVQTTRFIGKIAAGFILAGTIILFVLNLVNGMDPLRSVLHGFWLAISGFNTGGFTPTSQSVLYYHSFAIELVLMVLMLFGAVNFVLHSEIFKDRFETFFKDIEIRTLIIWLVVATVVFTASLAGSQLFEDLPSLLRRGPFLIVAAFTTTGFQTITTNQLTTVLTSGAFLVIAMMMAVGGGAGSTAGGMKLFRIGIIFKSIVSTVKEALSPDTARVVVTYTHVGRRTLSQETSREAMTIFMLFVITFALGTLVGIAHGYDATRAIFESVAMTSNGGLATIVSPGMPANLELVYIIQMWAGRLEFVTLIALVVEIIVSFKPRRKVERS